MRSLTKFSALGAAGIAAVLLIAPGAAAAGHGKAGLWTITTKMEMPGAAQMPDMSQLPPEVRARLRAMNMSANGNSMDMHMQHCVTQAEADRNGPPPMANKNCKLVRFQASGHTYSGDMTCTGEFNGTGHFQATYDSDEHYKGSMDIKGSRDGQPINMHSRFEGQWVSANCGNVTH